MRRKTIHTLVLLFAFGALSGCWESTNVTFHEPGVYLGPSDDLSTDESALNDRFANQQDR